MSHLITTIWNEILKINFDYRYLLNVPYFTELWDQLSWEIATCWEIPSLNYLSIQNSNRTNRNRLFKTNVISLIIVSIEQMARNVVDWNGQMRFIDYLTNWIIQ